MKRFIGFAADLVRANLGRTTPFKLTYIVTEECSCRCSICSLWKDPRPGADLSEIRQLFRANPHLSWINLSGGEVVDHDHFVEIVDAAVNSTRVCALDFPTAGQRPREVERRVREVLRTRLPRLFVTVSLDGPPELHDRIRGTAGAFEKASETLRRLRAIESKRLRVVAGLTLSSRNDSDPARLVEDVLASAPFLTRDDLHFNIAHHAPHYYRNRAGDTPQPERAIEFLMNERKLRRRRLDPLQLLESTYWRLAPTYLATQRSPVPCRALSSSAYVDPDLMLYPCATWDRPLVNLREVDYSLERAVHEEVARSARADARSRNCPGCWTPCEAYPTLLSGVVAAVSTRTDGGAQKGLRCERA